MSSSEIEPAEHLVRSLLRLGELRRAIGRTALSELGGQGFTTLAMLRRHGPARVSEVAAKLGVDLSVASRQLQTLEVAGFVRREADGDDRRARRSAITPQGRRALERSYRQLVAMFSTALGDWEPTELASLAAELERLCDDVASSRGDSHKREKTAQNA